MKRIKTAIGFPVVGGRKSYDGIVRSVKPENLLAGFPLNETAGYLAYDLVGSAVGIYHNVDLAAAVGPFGEPVASWPAGTTPVCRVYGQALSSALNPLLGSALLWYAPDGWNNGTRILWAMWGSGVNNIRIRQLNPANFDLNYEGNGVARTASVGSLSGNDFFPIIATWNKALDRIRLYVGSVIPVETNGLGTWNGGAVVTHLIGANTIQGTNAAPGDLCQLYLWDEELEASDVARLIEPVPGRTRNQTKHALAQNAPTALAIPTYDGSNQPTHPSIYDAGAGNTWNGYRFWMAMTPYPNAQNAYENPSILVSDDGETWLEPPGISNPVVPYPGEGYFNSDPCLVRVADRLYLFYRIVSATFYGLRYRYSDDGINWIGDAECLNVNWGPDIARVTSPCLLEDGGTWQMWTVDDFNSPRTLTHRTASSPGGPWSEAQVCTLEVPDGRSIWHLEVIREGHGYRIFFSAEDGLSADFEKSLYTGVSEDGLNWTDVRLVMEPLSHNWDGLQIYKPSLVANENGYDLYYAGVSLENVWKIGKTALVM